MIALRSFYFKKVCSGSAATGLFLLFACASGALPAQSPKESPNAPPKAPLAFDVSTVKLADPRAAHMMSVRVYPGGRVTLYTQSFQMLITEAFDVRPWQTVNGDKWLKDKYFDIEGIPPEGIRSRIAIGEYTVTGLNNAEEREMLQTLIIDRFHLKYHIEKRPGVVFLLERGDKPLRIESVEANLYAQAADGSMKTNSPYPTGDVSVVSGRPFGFHQTSMNQLAMALSDTKMAPVIDETKLPGFYNFRSQTIVSREDFQSGGVADLLQELVSEMGLKLVKTQGTVEKFVIDNVEFQDPN